MKNLPSRRRQPFGRQQLLGKMLIDADRASAHIAAGIRDAHPLEHPLNDSILAAGTVKSIEDHVRSYFAQPFHETFIKIQRSYVIPQARQRGYHALPA